MDSKRYALASCVDAAIAKLMVTSQVLLVTNKLIPLPAQRFMCRRAGATPREVPGGHAIYVSKPSAVAALVKTAAFSATALA